MGETGYSQVYALAAEIAGMVRREGQHDFNGVHGTAAATLCGLSVHTQSGSLTRIQACDIDLVFERLPANDDIRQTSHCRFRRGTLSDLQSWHGRLGRLHAFLAPSQEQAA